MSPARIEEPSVTWSSLARSKEQYDGPPRNIASIDALRFDPNLQPKNYEIAGARPDSKILFINVNILDSSGQTPYRGDVLIEGMQPGLFNLFPAKRRCISGLR